MPSPISDDGSNDDTEKAATTKRAPAVSDSLVIGIFVGGKASRMGGVDKGNLKAPSSSQTLVERLVGLAQKAAPSAELVLVGRSPAYDHLGLLALADRPSNVGPLGGLNALLSYAEQRSLEHAVALACDLPYVSQALLERLIGPDPKLKGSGRAPNQGAQYPAAVAPSIDGVYHPLFARYRTAPARRAAEAALQSGERALYRVLQRLEPEVTLLALSEPELQLLSDWDRPADLLGS